MIKTELNELVREEATNLKKFATRKELDKLDFKELNPNNVHRCIYGQMTGNCDNERAVELISKCCKKVDVNGSGDFISITSVKDLYSVKSSTAFLSPIENFIQLDRNIDTDNNKNLISYLKGEVDTLIIE